MWIGVLLLATNIVEAFGVTTPYWKENPLALTPGETKEVAFTLQNMVGDEDLRVRVELLGDKKYVELVEAKTVEAKTEYEIPAKTKDIPVPVRIKVPVDTPAGTKFQVRVSFTSTSKKGTNAVQLGTGIEKTFEVVIEEKESARPKVEAPAEKPSLPYTLWKKPATPAVIIILIVLILWIILRKSRKRMKKQAALPDNNARW